MRRKAEKLGKGENKDGATRRNGKKGKRGEQGKREEGRGRVQYWFILP